MVNNAMAIFRTRRALIEILVLEMVLLLVLPLEASLATTQRPNEVFQTKRNERFIILNSKKIRCKKLTTFLTLENNY